METKGFKLEVKVDGAWREIPGAVSYREFGGPHPGICFGCGVAFQAGYEPYHGIYCNQDCLELVCGPLGERGAIELSDVMKEENKRRGRL